MAAAAAVLLAAGSTVVYSALKRAHEGDRAIAQQTMQSFFIEAGQAHCFLGTTIGEHAPLQTGLQVCEQALGRYHVLQRDDWQQQVVWQRLNSEEQQRLAAEISELLMLLARARVRRAEELKDGTTDEALRNALALLEHARSIGGESRAICDNRAEFLESLDEPDEAQKAREAAEQMRPSTARDHYLLGTSYARNGRYRAAINELKEALILNPRDYWSHFHLGMYFRQQNQYDKAAMEFLACTVLWPDFSWAYHNLGEALHHSGKRLEAIEQYSAALERRPEIAQAYFNRGMLHLDLSEWDLALHDFENAMARGYNNNVLYGMRGIALAHLGHDDEANEAFARAWASGQKNGRKNFELLLSYAFLFSKLRPEEARKVFLEVLEQEPDNARAMYGCGKLLEQQRRDSEEAAAWFSRAIQLRPTFVEALLARALVRAHQGRGDTAVQDITLCEALDPKGQTLYEAACFYALLAAKSDQSLAASRAENALRLLGEAFKQGYERQQAIEDSDLDGIRDHPKFRELLQPTTKTKDPD
jgi:tetratricopeptide (TPR) repeat protein